MSQNNEYDNEIRLRLNITERQALLSSLMTLTDGECQNHHDRRKYNRYVPANTDAIAELEHPGGSKVSCAILVYDISARGIGFATRSYLHQHTNITIFLSTTDGEITKVQGRVMRCEYYDNRFHRIGIELSNVINPRIYVTSDEWEQNTKLSNDKSWMTPRKALHIESDELECNAVSMMLNNASFECTSVDSLGKAIDEIQVNSYDLVLLSDTIDPSGTLNALTQLQTNGYSGAIIVIASTKYSRISESTR